MIKIVKLKDPDKKIVMVIIHCKIFPPMQRKPLHRRYKDCLINPAVATYCSAEPAALYYYFQGLIKNCSGNADC